MPRWLSVGSVLTVLGAAYVFNTVWTFYGIYFPAWCKAPSNPQSPSTCLHPKFLCDQTDLILEGWVSRTEKFPTTDGSSKNAVRIFERDAPCAVPWEENFALDIETIWRKDATYYVHVLVLPKVRGKEVGSAHQKLTPAHASVVYQKVVMTKFMQEERTAMNLIQAGADDVNSTTLSLFSTSSNCTSIPLISRVPMSLDSLSRTTRLRQRLSLPPPATKVPKNQFQTR